MCASGMDQMTCHGPSACLVTVLQVVQAFLQLGLFGSHNRGSESASTFSTPQPCLSQTMERGTASNPGDCLNEPLTRKSQQNAADVSGRPQIILTLVSVPNQTQLSPCPTSIGPPRSFSLVTTIHESATLSQPCCSIVDAALSPSSRGCCCASLSARQLHA